MHTRLILAISLCLATLAAFGCKTDQEQTSTTTAATQDTAPARAKARPLVVYPTAKRVGVVDEIHGVRVPDPYRWLEDAGSPDRRQWVSQQVELAGRYFRSIPERDTLAARLRQLYDYERYGLPQSAGGRLFFTRNDGLQDQPELLVADGPDATPRLLLDANKLSEDGTTALARFTPSPDGRLLAYSVSEGGSDWMTWRVRDVETGEDLPNALSWTKFTNVSWSADGAGFYYSRYDAPEPGKKLQAANKFNKLFYHRIGQAQPNDTLVYERADQPEWMFFPQVSDDGRWLVVQVSHGFNTNAAVVRDLRAGTDAPFIDLLMRWDAIYRFVGSQGSELFFWTDKDAPLGRVVAIDPSRPEPENWREVIPEDRHALEDVSFVGNRLIASYLVDVKSQVRVFSPRGALLRDVTLPGIGSTSGFYGRADDRYTYFAFTSFTTPTTIYRYEPETGRQQIFKRPGASFDPDDYVVRQVFYSSKDGTRVPMFIAHKRDLPTDRPARTLLYAYGGFNIAITPRFSPMNLAWLEQGGVYAVANLRGGSEYGKAWHQAGTTTRKQNVFDDFIAAAEYLIDEGITSSDRLAIRGGSNGGLLVGACMTQRPDLFGACVAQVGVLDMLRFHLFTIGHAWVSEYGSADNPDQFPSLLAYSPYHNVRTDVCYPPTLITTADHDDRVVPAHSYKFGAALQKAQGCANPIIMRIETRVGHGAGAPVSKRIDEQADITAFLLNELSG